jgi:uncharacterized membrane protein YkvA (DUF1232 family)
MMSGPFGQPFTPKEIEAMRKLAADEDRLGHSMLRLLGRVARSIPFAQDALAAWCCARDPATPARVRFILIAAVAYFVLPIDTIPDIVPLLGFTDDAAVLTAAIASVAGEITPEHRDRARVILKGL